MASDSALDARVIDSLRQLTPAGEADVLAEILHLFLDEVPKKLRALQEAVDGADAPEAARVAHSLKGSSGNIGAGDMMAMCSRIDDLARAGNLAAIAPLLPSLTSEYHRAELEIKHLLQTS